MRRLTSMIFKRMFPILIISSASSNNLRVHSGILLRVDGGNYVRRQSSLEGILLMSNIGLMQSRVKSFRSSDLTISSGVANTKDGKWRRKTVLSTTLYG